MHLRPHPFGAEPASCRRRARPASARWSTARHCWRQAAAPDARAPARRSRCRAAASTCGGRSRSSVRRPSGLRRTPQFGAQVRYGIHRGRRGYRHRRQVRLCRGAQAMRCSLFRAPVRRPACARYGRASCTVCGMPFMRGAQGFDRGDLAAHFAMQPARRCGASESGGADGVAASSPASCSPAPWRRRATRPSLRFQRSPSCASRRAAADRSRGGGT